MKLKKFRKENIILRKIPFLIVLCIVVAVISVTISYAIYQKTDEILFINAKVGQFETQISDINIAMEVDGIVVSEVPEKNDLYTVEVSCDNAVGVWNKDNWDVTISNMTQPKVKCNINFITPIPTIDNVQAQGGKGNISISYKVDGINPSTICKYGTEEGYYSNVVESTNEECNITNLEEHVIYYYQVCVSNTGGSKCVEGSKKTGLLGDIVEIGNYIKMTPTSTSYTPSSSDTGYTSTLDGYEDEYGKTLGYSAQQALNPSELNEWVVISKNTDGSVDVVSRYVSSTVVWIGGLNGYKNYIGTLNKIAAQYTNDKFVSKARIMGYDGKASEYCSKSPSAHNDITSCPEDTGYKTDIDLVNASIGNIIGYTPGNKTPVSYWLGSRLIRWEGTDKNTAPILYGSRISRKGTVGTFDEGFYIIFKTMNRIDYSGVYSRIRPILTLKHDVVIKSGDGTVTSPYELSS